MAVHITLSTSTCLLLGAGFGVTMALIIPSSCDADDKKKQENNNHEFKNVATNTSKIDEEKPSKFYGDKTVSEILEKAKLGIRKVWDRGWRIVLLKSKSSLSCDVFDSAQSSFPKTNSQNKGNFDLSLDSDDTNSFSTTYTPVGKLSVSKYSSFKKGIHKRLDAVVKGYKRSNTSKNDSICKHYPTHASTLINEDEKKTIVEESIENENTGTTDESNSNDETDNNKKLVLRFRTSFSPIIRVFQTAKRFKRSKKRAKETSDVNAEINNSNGIQEVVAT